jgi:hypothetical protein
MLKIVRLIVDCTSSGVVRAGQWARRLIINDCLDSGTQIPYVREAQKLGFAVLVLNSNLNQVETEELKTIRGSESPLDHGIYVWQNLVQDQVDDHCVAKYPFVPFITNLVWSYF